MSHQLLIVARRLASGSALHFAVKHQASALILRIYVVGRSKSCFTRARGVAPNGQDEELEILTREKSSDAVLRSDIRLGHRGRGLTDGIAGKAVPSQFSNQLVFE